MDNQHVKVSSESITEAVKVISNETLDNEIVKTDDNINKHVQETEIKPLPIKLYICTYILLFMYLGAFYSIPSAIFNFIQHQLNISTKQVGLLWSVYDITYGISAVISGVMIDINSIYKYTHIYIALFIIISLILLCIMSLINHYPIMIIIWILLSYSQGIFDCCIGVYIYKLYLDVQKSTILLTSCHIIALITMTLFLPVIDLSISLFNSYAYSMYLLTILAIPTFILTLILSPPSLPNAIKPQHVNTNSDIPLHSPQLTVINNYTSINIAGILGLGLSMNKTMENTNMNDINILQHLEVSKTINIHNTTPCTPITPSEIDSARNSISILPQQTSIQQNVSWFNIEEKLHRISQQYTNDIFMLAMNIDHDDKVQKIPKHDKILGLDKHNKFDHKMDIIRENKTFSKDFLDIDIPSSNDSQIIHDFNAIQMQKKLIKLFALITMCLMACYQSQNVVFGAYISIYSINYIGSSKQVSLYFVTAFFSGITVGRCMTIYLLKKFRADNSILFCCVTMFINGLFMLLLHILYDLNFINQNIFETLLYFILIIAGILSSPLFNASYSFLSLIQPITGFVTSLLFAGYCIGGAITAFIVGIFVDIFDAKIIPYSLVIQLFICVIIAVFIKLLYVKYHTKYG